jgi:hypothetical protein
MKTMLIVLLMIAAERPAPIEPNKVPFALDANLLQYDLMDWAFCDPNVSVSYQCTVYTKSGRGMGGFSVTELSDPNAPINVSVLYLRRDKDPNGPGWGHVYEIFYTPGFEGVHYLHLRAWYGKKSFTPHWQIPTGASDVDNRIILLNAVADDTPFLLPGTFTVGPNASRRKEAQIAWQRNSKLGLNFGPTTILR